MFYSKRDRKVIDSMIGSHVPFANKSGKVRYQPAMANGRLMFSVPASYYSSSVHPTRKWGDKKGRPPAGSLRTSSVPLLVSRREANRIARKQARRDFKRDYVDTFESLYATKTKVER
ncbi:hypothetical protein ISF9_047 [Microbacterium phage vB_MoxS-ISF9]|uniref:Uncharacterized protein n=1 Tax=Microbacterium phage vB_MoxS-ISF9 TaxID=1458670 RepID=W8P095_9CAUD|nr:hypothetical protein ISF9_047 [Microbacterium phage vB_MoxS-ISF9]AHL18517.1 hypothetical protein ISF9_047 [Microbacterium phage vB_MoxS-ISF9]